MSKEAAGHFIGVVKIGDRDCWVEYYVPLPYTTESRAASWVKKYSSEVFVSDDELRCFEVDNKTLNIYRNWYLIDQAINSLQSCLIKFDDLDESTMEDLERMKKEVTNTLGIKYPEFQRPSTKSDTERWIDETDKFNYVVNMFFKLYNTMDFYHISRKDMHEEILRQVNEEGRYFPGITKE